MAEVDVLLPIRAPAPWLRETLEGLKQQTGIDWHLIAVIHGEDQGMRALIESFNIPVTIANAPEAGNLADVLNLGLSLATSMFVARIDHDDIPEPNRLQRQCQALRNDPECAVLASSATLINESGQVVGIRECPESAEDVLRTSRWKTAIMHPTVTFRRDVIVGLGGYSHTAVNVEDYELWLRVLVHRKIRSLPERLLRYRLHSGQMTQTKLISKSAAKVIRDSRLALARARGESLVAAEFRQLVWATKQSIRRNSRT